MDCYLIPEQVAEALLMVLLVFTTQVPLYFENRYACEPAVSQPTENVTVLSPCTTAKEPPPVFVVLLETLTKLVQLL